MSCIPLTDIERACRPATGLSQLSWYLPEAIAAAAPVSLTTAIETVLLKSGYRKYTIEFDEGASWRESQVSTEHGDRYDQTIDFTVRKLRKEVSDTFYALRHRRIAVELLDNEGERYFFKALRPKADREINASRNGYTVTLAGSSLAPTQSLPNLIAIAPGNAFGNPDNNTVWGDPDSNSVWGW